MTEKCDASGARFLSRLSQDALNEALADVSVGDGNELRWTLRKDGSWLPPSLYSAYSSCGLAINSFGPWRLDPRDIPLYGGGFHSCAFEVKLPIRTLESRRCPNLDVVFASSERVVAIESKLLETLTPTPPARYQASYAGAVAALDIDPSCDRLYREGREHFCYAGVGQLVRHYLGLKTQIGEGGAFSGAGEATLLYLYWEPDDAAGNQVRTGRRS